MAGRNAVGRFALPTLLLGVAACYDGPSQAQGPLDPALTARLVEVELDSGGVSFHARLSLPEAGDGPFAVAAFFTGSGPSPHRFYVGPEANFFDSVAALLNDRGIGYFTWDKRGCADSSQEPYYTLDEEVYASATSTSLVADAEVAFDWLEQHTLVDRDRVLVWGQSMGTTTAPVFVQRNPDRARGMILTGWMVQNLREIVWDIFCFRSWYQASLFADTDRDGAISGQEWGALSAEQRDRIWVGLYSLDQLDGDGDGSYTAHDEELFGQPSFDEWVRIVLAGDEEAHRRFWGDFWIYYPSVAWVQSELSWPALPAVLSAVDLPTVVLQGELDVLAPLPRLEPMRAAMARGEYPHMRFELIPGADHYLGWRDLALGAEPSMHMRRLVETAVELAK